MTPARLAAILAAAPDGGWRFPTSNRAECVNRSGSLVALIYAPSATTPDRVELHLDEWMVAFGGTVPLPVIADAVWAALAL